MNRIKTLQQELDDCWEEMGVLRRDRSSLKVAVEELQR
jgi:hypothetical protein